MASKYWCLTINYSNDFNREFDAAKVGDLDEFDYFNTRFGEIRDSLSTLVGLRYLCGQVEIGDLETRRHWQLYVEFKQNHRLPALRKALPAVNGRLAIHAEIRHGTRDAARAYCDKEQTREVGPYEWGNWVKGPGARTDIDGVAKLLLAKGLDAAIEAHPGAYIRFHGGMEKLDTWNRYRVERTRIRHDLRVHVLWGDTNLGKTTKAIDHATGRFWVSSTPTNGAWYAYGYNGEPYVIMDDFKCGWFKAGAFVRLMDKFPTSTNLSGRGVPWIPTTIVITCQTDPWLWYGGVDEATRAAVLRRIHRVTHVTHLQQVIDWTTHIPDIRAAVVPETGQTVDWSWPPIIEEIE